MTTDEIVLALRNAAQEIAREGHAGWGNICALAADEIERLQGLGAPSMRWNPNTSSMEPHNHSDDLGMKK